MEDEEKRKNNVAVLILTIILTILFYGVFWIAICGVVKLITMIFGITYTWLIATLVWLIIVVIIGATRGIIKVSKKQ